MTHPRQERRHIKRRRGVADVPCTDEEAETLLYDGGAEMWSRELTLTWHTYHRDVKGMWQCLAFKVSEVPVAAKQLSAPLHVCRARNELHLLFLLSELLQPTVRRQSRQWITITQQQTTNPGKPVTHLRPLCRGNVLLSPHSGQGAFQHGASVGLKALRVCRCVLSFLQTHRARTANLSLQGACGLHRDTSPRTLRLSHVSDDINRNQSESSVELATTQALYLVLRVHESIPARRYAGNNNRLLALPPTQRRSLLQLLRASKTP